MSRVSCFDQTTQSKARQSGRADAESSLLTGRAGVTIRLYLVTAAYELETGDEEGLSPAADARRDEERGVMRGEGRRAKGEARRGEDGAPC